MSLHYSRRRSSPNLSGLPPAKTHGGGKGGHTPGSAKAKPSSGALLLGSRPAGSDEGEFAMPKQKDLKRVVRSRMQKTGESYTTARVHVLNRKSEKAVVAEQAKPDYAAIAGVSDAAVKKA